MDENNELEFESPEKDILTEEELDAFQMRLKEAEELGKTEGPLAGLCEFCMGTDFAYVKRSDGYTGISYVVNNELPSLQKCTHGESIEDLTKFAGF